MRVLIACEESQAVCKAFREKGHESYSCDIIECSGGHPEWHIKQDVIPLLNGNCSFKTTDGTEHSIVGKWDIIIAFPPCTDLCVSGARHFEKKRKDGRQRESIEFFCKFLDADCDKIAIENPVGIISGDYIPKHFPDLADKHNLPRKQSQIIQPYEYGHQAKKQLVYGSKVYRCSNRQKLSNQTSFRTLAKTVRRLHSVSIWYEALKTENAQNQEARLSPVLLALWLNNGDKT
jgi:site-specific DNA-cytosine methylase